MLHNGLEIYQNSYPRQVKKKKSLSLSKNQNYIHKKIAPIKIRALKKLFLVYFILYATTKF